MKTENLGCVNLNITSASTGTYILKLKFFVFTAVVNIIFTTAVGTFIFRRHIEGVPAHLIGRILQSLCGIAYQTPLEFCPKQ